MKFSRLRLVGAACLLLIGMMLRPAVHAEEVPTILQTIKLYEAVLRFPAPIWVKTKEQMGDFKASQHQENNSFVLEQIPKAQSFDDWSNMYGVYAWYLPEYDLKRFANESINALAMGCAAQAKIVALEAEKDTLLMVFQCPQLVEPLARTGKTVESVFLFMGQVDNTFVKVYQAWRGTPEDVQSESWPSNKQVLLDVVEQMQRIRLLKQ